MGREDKEDMVNALLLVHHQRCTSHLVPGSMLWCVLTPVT